MPGIPDIQVAPMPTKSVGLNMPKKKFKAKRKRKVIIRRKKATSGVATRPPSPACRQPPSNIPKTNLEDGKGLWYFEQTCFDARQARSSTAERRFVLEEYERLFAEEPPPEMFWELVKVRIIGHLQYLDAKQRGKEDRLTEEFWRNYRAAWGKAAEGNSVREFSPDVRGTFRFLYERAKEDRPMATMKKNVAKKEKTNKKSRHNEIFGSSVAAVVRRLGKEKFGFNAADAFLQKYGVKGSPAMIRTYLYAGKAGTRGTPAPLSKVQLAQIRKFLSNFSSDVPKPKPVAKKKKVAKKTKKK